MFYVKGKINDSVEVSVEIHDDNVFCSCPGCGNEVRVDLSDVFVDQEGDLFSTAVYCDECSRKIRSSYGRVSYGN